MESGSVAVGHRHCDRCRAARLVHWFVHLTRMLKDLRGPTSWVRGVKLGQASHKGGLTRPRGEGRTPFQACWEGVELLGWSTSASAVSGHGQSDTRDGCSPARRDPIARRPHVRGVGQCAVRRCVTLQNLWVNAVFLRPVARFDDLLFVTSPPNKIDCPA